MSTLNSCRGRGPLAGAVAERWAISSGLRLDAAPGCGGPNRVAATSTRHVLPGGGTYGAERQIAFDALVAAGYTDEIAAFQVQRADQYFMGELGMTLDTPTRIPTTRRTHP